MSKDTNPRRVADNEAMAKLRMLTYVTAETKPRGSNDPWQES